ncbi:MAG TPA: RHS repeat-associated core domain-containing protein [Allosphingosinicella sp.]|jgi:RHS repeat-associated protein
MPSLNPVSQPLVDALARGLRRRQIPAALQRQGFRLDPLGPDSFRVSDAEERSATLSFEPDGGVRTQAADGRTATSWFDSDGKLVRCIDPAGLDLTVSPAPGGGRRFSRSGFGDFVVAHDPFGLPTRFEFPDGSRSSIDWDAPGGETITDRAGNVAQRLRDDEGRQVGAVDFRGGRTHYSGGGSTGSIEVRSPAGRHDRFDLDVSGGLAAWHVDGKEIARARGASLPGLPGEIRYADGHWVKLEADEGRLIAAHGPNGTVRLEYDAAGRLIAEDQNGLVVRYQRDRTGLLTGIRLPDGAQIGFRWDDSGRLTQIRDWDGGVTRLAWAASGQIEAVDHPNGARTAAQSDRLARVTATASQAGDGAVLHEARYGYDAMDRLVDAVENGVARRYSYDPIGRLTGVAAGDPAIAESWQLDAAGNRQVDRGIPYAADGDNRISGAGRHAIEHDNLGRIRRAALPAGDATLHYNAQGQLVRAELGSAVAEYAYDALGRRIWKRVNGRLTRFLWAGQTLLSEIRDPGPGWTRRDHLFLPDLFLPVAMRVDGIVYRQHCDRRGAPVALTGADGGCAWQATLKPFGTASIAVAQVDNPWRLLNQYGDEETGLHYNLARYLHPELGRYLTPDPLFAAANRGNHYVFAGGDPLTGCDPTGELPQLLVGVLIGAAVGAVIGAGVKMYETRNQDWSWDRAGEIGKAALVGGAMGAAGVLAAAAVVAAFPAEVGVAAAVGIGGLAGAVSAVVETCIHAAAYDQALTAEELATSAVLGFGVGAVTFGTGAVAAQRARRAAQELAEAEAAAVRREAARRLAEEEAEVLKKAAAAQKATQTPPITITQKGLKHTTERHTNSGPPKYANKSKFNDNESVVDLVSSGAGQPTTAQPNGNLSRTWDTGRNIGVDRATGQQTSVMTVITKPNGELVTAFPGRP